MLSWVQFWVDVKLFVVGLVALALRGQKGWRLGRLCQEGWLTSSIVVRNR